MVSSPSAISFVFVKTVSVILACIIPINTPNKICFTIVAPRGMDSPTPIMLIAIIVSRYAIGSLLPLSTSRIDAVPLFRFSFFFRKIANTLAASVEESTAPIRKLSAAGRCRIPIHSNAVTPAVTATPNVDRIMDLAATAFAADHLVLKPP